MKQSKLHGSHLVPVRIFDQTHPTLNVYVRGYEVRDSAFTDVGFKVAKCYVHRGYVAPGTMYTEQRNRDAKLWTLTDAATGASIIAFCKTPQIAIEQGAIKLAAAGEWRYHDKRREVFARLDTAHAKLECTANEAKIAAAIAAARRP